MNYEKEFLIRSIGFVGKIMKESIKADDNPTYSASYNISGDDGNKESVSSCGHPNVSSAQGFLEGVVSEAWRRVRENNSRNFGFLDIYAINTDKGKSLEEEE